MEGEQSSCLESHSLEMIVASLTGYIFLDYILTAGINPGGLVQME